jgi:ferredoxin-NADP reductase/predicted pyridoxine 5'-phosphate oxidase superfamily flavin-nucleotide-binding protein/ferredoxin
MGTARFHDGELEVQQRTGVRAQVAGASGLRDFMPDQHRQFFGELPFFFIGALDDAGQPWASLLIGAPGFIASPDARTLVIDAAPLPGDPLAGMLRPGRPLGGLGLAPATRRRNRVNGTIEAADAHGIRLAVTQSFGNCPQYIQARAHTAVAARAEPLVRRAATLSPDDRALIARADTFFIASANMGEQDGGARGADVSHRGGRPGFVRIDDARTLTTPEFIGNFFFNTLGNLVRDARAGLLFIDFDSGDLLQLAVDAEVIWDGPEVRAFSGAERLLRLHIRDVRRNVGALPLRWSAPQAAGQLARTGDWLDAARVLEAGALAAAWRPFRVAAVTQESPDVRSFYLEPADGHGVAPHRPGQFASLRTPDGRVRSYTLSDAADGRCYRISVKRAGAVSGWLHDTLAPGATIALRGPAGGFVFEEGTGRPAVLLSAGIGITPMIAMLGSLLVNGDRSRHRHPIHVIHGSRGRADLAFGERLRALAAGHRNLHVHLRYSGPDGAADAALETGIVNLEAGAGRVDVALLKRALPFDDYDFYLCGPATFMQDLYDGLRALNVPDERIRFEAFGPASVRRAPSPGEIAAAMPARASASAAESAAAAPVHMARSGADLVWDERHASLLEFAEAHGLPADSGCRTGACGSCAVRLLGGEVDATRACSAQPGPGRILLCSTVPRAGSGMVTLDL